jgi:trehalose/maltose hydrolase-like predicted phosphorylase
MACVPWGPTDTKGFCDRRPKHRRTYVAGLFDTPGAAGAVPKLIPAADWLKVRILLPGGPLVHDPGDLSSHRMMLDMRRGAFLTECRHLGRLPLGVRVRTFAPGKSAGPNERMTL